MKAAQFFNIQVGEIAARDRITTEAAARLVSTLYPDVATLNRACGRTQAEVQEFHLFEARRAAAPKKAEAREKFHELVRAEMANSKEEYDVCYKRVSKRCPTEFSNATADAKVPTFANEALGASADGPLAAPQLKFMFRLPMDATQEEFNVAWKANGSNAMVGNWGAIFDALCEYQQAQRSIGVEAAITYSKARYPDMWDLVSRQSKYGK